MNRFYPGVAQEAEKVLSWLDAATILLTGHDGSYGGVQYDDHREEENRTGDHIRQPRLRDVGWGRLLRGTTRSLRKMLGMDRRAD